MDYLKCKLPYCCFFAESEFVDTQFPPWGIWVIVAAVVVVGGVIILIGNRYCRGKNDGVLVPTSGWVTA